MASPTRTRAARAWMSVRASAGIGRRAKRRRRGGGMTRRTPELATRPWRLVGHLLLGLWDCDGFAEVWLCWWCPRCHTRCWADGVVHRSTPPMTPAQWERLTLETGPWQAQVERERARARQAQYVHAQLRASVQR